jgi:short-subunit dehydrogenase
MIQRKSGGIVFTSSCVPFIPSPFITIYGSTKAFLSQFATSLSIEAKNNNIDVFLFNPQFNKTNLYNNSPKLFVLRVMGNL